MRASTTIAALATQLLAIGVVHADSAGFAKTADDGVIALDSPAESSSIEFHGAFRARGEMLYNFDLDRGLDASGSPLFPIPADERSQALTGANLRLRTDVRFRGPGTGLSVVLRTDVLDNLTLGSTPSLRDGTPASSTGQNAPLQAMRVKRAYGEAVLPIGVLTVGRQGSHWGLGMVANSGDAEGSDQGDAADRIAFLTPLVGHIFALAYDISATGPLQDDTSLSRSIDIEPTDDVQNLTFAFMRYHSESARARRSRAGRTTVEYGAYASHRWQQNDIPSDYLGDGANASQSSVTKRGFSATATDAWFRFTTPNLRIEAEAAYLRAEVEQASLIPGVEFYEPATSNQFGAALQSSLQLSSVQIGLDAGLASGDASPGFGAQASDAQANPPFDNRIDNFRFHTDYRVDRILFREIIGTITDAWYLRPHLRVPLINAGGARLTFDTAFIASWAMEPSSTPSGQRALGLEVDPTLRYETSDGFVAALEYALLMPMSGFDNPAAGLDAQAAQLLRLHLEFPF